MAVVDQLRIPLVGLGAEEAVEALEAAARRPVAPRGGEVHLGLGAQVPLADHVRVPALLAEDLLDLPVLGRDHAARVREAARRLGDAGHAVARVIAAGQQARPGRRAQRRRVPLRVAHARVGDPVDVRRLDRPAVARHRREPDVIEHGVHHVRRALGARGGSNGDQSGTESRMSTLILPLNGMLTTRSFGGGIREAAVLPPGDAKPSSPGPPDRASPGTDEAAG